jgi:diguanylate cyclase (GGDEF)-like protein
VFLRPSFYRQLTHPRIRSRSELVGFVVRTTVVCTLIAVGADIVNQLSFFVDWEVTLRSWMITTVLASGIAIAATWAIGRAHLELYEAKLVVETLSRTDPLTGLPNRRAFFEVAERTSPEAMILIIIDVDHFKEINDARGHLAGDEVIRIVSRMMAVELDTLGYLARVGGDEFAIVGSKIDTDHLVACLGAFHARLAGTPIVISGSPVPVTISAGVGVRASDQSLNDLYADADRALYAAKSLGRNRVSYTASFQSVVDTRFATNEAKWHADTDVDRRRSSVEGDATSVA